MADKNLVRFGWAMASKYIAANYKVVRDAWVDSEKKITKKMVSIQRNEHGYCRRDGTPWAPSRVDMAADDWSICP